MKISLIPALVLTAALIGATLAPAAAVAAERARPAGGSKTIDWLVFGMLKTLDIQPAKQCTDAVFVRRVYLDVIGTLPTAAEARAFILDKSPDKRRVLIDQLLERDEFADYWAMKWSDLLRVKAEFPINLWPNAAKAYHHWIRTSIKTNRPYDQFARELITASGSNFRVPQVNFYRALQSKEPTALAQAVALMFMGTRADKWDKARLDGMATFFSHVGFKYTQEWKEEVVYFDSVKAAKDAAAGKTRTGVFPDGTRLRLSPAKDPREVFADWLITPKNPWFARNAVNRVWYWLVGRGIIHEADDVRPDNPASNPQLLALLARELVASKYDMKHVYRLILNSRTYQLSAVPASMPASKRPAAEANFAYYPIRRLEAEVLIDALCQITGTTEQYSSLIPEPFTFIPPDCRSIALPDGSITSAFLDMFGRPARDTGLESERNNNPTAAQRLHLLNSSHIRRKIEQSRKLRSLMTYSRKQPGKPIISLYLAILSRFPTQAELKTIKAYADSGAKAGVRGSNVFVDVAWALINSSEFQYRH